MTYSSPTRSADAWRGGRDARERTLAPTRRMIGPNVCHAMQPVGLVMGVANNVRVQAGFSSVGKRSDDTSLLGMSPSAFSPSLVQLNLVRARAILRHEYLLGF